MSAWSRDTDWRQGRLLSVETMTALIPADVMKDSNIAVVVSHDCDLAQDCRNEPSVEVILGYQIEKEDGNYTHAKNLRRLHLTFLVGDNPLRIELHAGRKVELPKEGANGLADHEPEAARLHPSQLNTLQHWLAARYRRAAFPDEFDRRLGAQTGLRDDLAKILKPLGNQIVAIFFDVDQGEEVEHDGAGDTFTLGIYLLYTTLRLPYELKQLFREWLALHAPQRAEHVMSLLQQMNDGRDYDSNFATRMHGQGVFADLLRRRFEVASRKQGFARTRELQLDATRFVPPRKPSPQGDLF